VNDWNASWCDVPNNVNELGRLFVEDGIEAKELLHYFERPWKWTKEWEHRKEHDTNLCTGILSCGLHHCDDCMAEVPSCQTEYSDNGEGDDLLCAACRAKREAA
jgi:hypothetical protein